MGVWLSGTFGNFLTVSGRGTVVEAEAGSGRVVRRMRLAGPTERVEVTCGYVTSGGL